ncbi:helix-turn-helix domain-containing protein [Pseudarthrobacter sp. AL07]|uniref:helix-turn-helix domain-containing protein n=1 Tax=unclassified Pseudarthrobacter TaxID=2647000 RepID=UPI00249B0C24|nr:MULTISPECIES: helix-turn-helix domain-containing protein [unclassified Pseudarthrobacter]MDI3194252.1 helix-turn-helix domain-containing protein [Pseudarthrobacter sp. AL20]MDI3208318.1 helix-turn-helix domain-containing protein [Pseudarthrobacter sp. AL07]
MVSVPGVPCQPLQYLTAVAKSELSSGTKATCWALASFANTKTGEAYPTVATLAKAVGLSGPTVSQHTKRAEAAGYLHKHVRHNNSILYTITIPVTDDMIINLDTETSLDLLSPPEDNADRNE